MDLLIIGILLFIVIERIRHYRARQRMFVRRMNIIRGSK